MTGILNALIAGVSGAVKDAYFNLVSLLLPGNGTNGAQNNTFLDSSGNTFTITRNGNTTQGTFSPFSQTGWGAYFDGSNDTVSLSGTPITTTTWTIEAWVYLTGGIVERNLYSQATAGNANRTQLFFYAASGTDPYISIFSASGNQSAASTSRVTSNQWNHIAIQCNGTNVTFYINGQQSGSSSFTASWQSTAGVIGSYLSSGFLSGYVSNFRITNTNVYPGNFTPSTTPLTNIPGTQILTFQNNRFIDNASTPNTLTPNNGTVITPFSPFAPTAKYEASAVGGSGYFDGTGDYLEISNNAAFQFGSGDFTLESWVYLTSYNASAASIIIQKYTGAFPTCEFLFQIGTNGSIGLAVDSTSAETFIGTTSNAVPVAAWTHCVATKSGSALRIFVNGKLVKYGTTALTIATTTTPVQIGNNMFGYSGGTRVFKGSIPTDYQTSSTTEGTQIFTPPTAPLTTTSQGGSSPSLLLNFTNAGVVDATAKNVLETVGNAQISTTQSKWGGGSIYFDGTGSPADYLSFPDSPTIRLGSSDFVFECWARFDDFSSTRHLCFLNGNTSAYAGLRLGVGTDSKIFLLMSQNGSTFAVSSGAIGSALSANTWYYIAVQRSSAGVKVFVDGSQIGITYSLSGSVMSGTVNYIGEITSVSQPMKGYMDDVRLTLYARTITASPTAPFPVQ